MAASCPSLWVLWLPSPGDSVHWCEGKWAVPCVEEKFLSVGSMGRGGAVWCGQVWWAVRDVRTSLRWERRWQSQGHPKGQPLHPPVAGLC